MDAKELIPLHLSVAVPLHVAELLRRGGPDDEDFRRLSEIALDLSANGDRLLYRSDRAGDLINKLAYSMAVMSFCPGGVKAFGLKFESQER